MQKKILKNVDDWHAWANEMNGQVVFINHGSPPCFPCVVVWFVDRTVYPNLRFTFVEHLDFGTLSK